MDLIAKVFELSGILDGIRGNQLRREISNIVEEGADIILIDLKDVKFIDNSGLEALVSSMQIVKNANGKLFLCSVSDQVKMLLQLTKLDKVFQTFDDQDDFRHQILTVQQISAKY